MWNPFSNQTIRRSETHFFQNLNKASLDFCAQVVICLVGTLNVCLKVPQMMQKSRDVSDHLRLRKLPKPAKNCKIRIWMIGLIGSRKKVRTEKVWIAKKSLAFFLSNLFPPIFFLAHMDLKVLQIWQTTHFKACSKWWRMKW